MKTSKIPELADLLPYVSNRAEAVQKFQVTEKTIIRWMKQYEIYQPIRNCVSKKLNFELAQQIRELHKTGKTINELSTQFKVTPSAIGRAVHGITYKEGREVADVQVIYNHIADRGASSG